MEATVSCRRRRRTQLRQRAGNPSLWNASSNRCSDIDTDLGALLLYRSHFYIIPKFRRNFPLTLDRPAAGCESRSGPPAQAAVRNPAPGLPAGVQTLFECVSGKEVHKEEP